MSAETQAGPAGSPASADTAGGTAAGLLIGGARRPGDEKQRMDVVDPATGSSFAEVASAGVADGRAAVGAARAASAEWAATPPRRRAEVLRRAFELMTAREGEFAELIVRENGKTLADARAEVAYAAEFFRWYSEEAVRGLGAVSRSPAGDKRILVEREPVGVALLITPWNFPAAMATRKLAPALAAGCTTVLKPADETPLTALLLGELLQGAGAPPGAVNVVPTARSPEVVAAMTADDAVRKVSFTGSTEVGRLLLRQAADRVLDCSMELGGNAPFLLLPDADVDDAVEGALVAKMRNGGEACTAANRFYVHTTLVDEFTSKFTAALESQRVGPGLDPRTDVGPLISERHRAKVAGLVREAVASGASLVTGGRAPGGEGFYYEPTVLGEVPADADILRSEIFGPVSPIVAFDDEDEAVAAANATEYGLVSYVYSRDLGRALRVGGRLEAGMVAVNRGLVSDPAAPFGGYKHSGLGREGAHDGLLEFLETKYYAVDW